MAAEPLGILAGGGRLPRLLIDACNASGRPVFVIGFAGHTDEDTVRDVPHAWERLGAAGRIISVLRDAGVRDLVLAGSIRRPSISALRPDWRAAKLFARAGIRSLGDDGLLRAVMAELEGEGFRLAGVSEIMSQLLMQRGVAGHHRPDEGAWADIRRGAAVVRGVGPLDVGQSAVVQQGLVLGIEAIEGTDALIRRCTDLARPGDGGVLVKMSKPGQDRRADLPTIGPMTVEAAAAAGLRGIAVEAGETLVVDLAATIHAADSAGLFLIGIDDALLNAD